MRKILSTPIAILFILIITLPVKSFSLTKEEMYKFSENMANSNFEAMVESFIEIIKTKKQEELEEADYFVITAVMGYIVEFGYSPKNSKYVEKLMDEFFDNPGNQKSMRPTDAIYWSAYLEYLYSSGDDIDWLISTLPNWDSENCSGFGCSASISKLVNWKLTKYFITTERYYEAEMLLLNTASQQINFEYDRASVILNLSRMASFYYSIHRSDLAKKISDKAWELLDLHGELKPHIYLPEILGNLIFVDTFNNNSNRANKGLEIYYKLFKNSQKYNSPVAKAQIAHAMAWTAAKNLDSAILEKSNKLHSEFIGDIPGVDVDYLYRYLNKYIDSVKNKNCKGRALEYEKIEREALLNFLRVLEIDRLTFCGDFNESLPLLSELKINSHHSINSSKKGLVRSFHQTSYGEWVDDIILRSLYRLQEKNVILDYKVNQDVLDILITLNSSASEFEMEALD